VLVEVEKEMARRRLIAPGDHVVFASEVRASEPVDLVRVSVDSPEWARMERSTERLFAFKTGLIAVCGLLAAALVGLVLLDQGRKQRFLQLRSDFVATVSHELRTPLASLRVMTETLERRVSGTPGMRDYPARMIGEIDHLIFLVENILSFNRLDKGRWAPNVGDVALTDVLPSIHEEASNFSRVPVMVHAESLDGARVSADPEMLRLLFANLTRNACQYNARDCVDIRIDAARTDRLRVLFSDNGTGVSETDRERIFDEFYRGKSAPSGSRGSGLGLALCRRIMQLHRGTIRVADSGPEGTTFELTFL
jgi:signal transduction histidine kinase